MTQNQILSAKTIDSAKPLAEPYRIHDAKVQGLHLRVQPSGVKSYCLVWARNRTLTLGRHPQMTLDGARRAAIAKLAQTLEHGAPIPSGKSPKIETFGDFMREQYAPWVIAERKAGQATVNAIAAQFSAWYSKPIGDVTAWSIEKFKSARLKSGTMPATVNRDLDRIRSALGKAVEWGLLTEHPLRSVKRVKGVDDSRVRYLSVAEDKRLRTALVKREGTMRTRRISGNEWITTRKGETRHEWGESEFADHLQPLVLLAVNTGLRRGELFGLTWDAVDLDGKRLTVRAGTAKSGRARHVQLNSEAVDALKRWQKTDSGAGLVFPGAEGGRMTNINKSWAGLIALAKIEAFRFHDLRHTFASNLVMAGVDLNTVRELLGHADITMTLRYSHLAPEHKAAAVETLVRINR